MTTVEVDPVEVRERTADDKGRITLGADYSGETVRVAVLDVPSEDDSERRVTVCEDCGEVWAGLRSHCGDCGSEAIRQVEPREVDR